ncbi:hypothetical protein L249_5838 [Ophiocordyceps polyrhachis-furcata BCC 54312]|uniref:Uncharacterized protein n=1 Tax=Ophiocordyceps polyrhachis-furcata BCC 54312 TaxID=1330021 RepID=A0A367L0G3_9HYPO|nr:hypothetical protein L249_5838 [Ophiocordyceps polyrhachis-furcata BCC 54312]
MAPRRPSSSSSSSKKKAPGAAGSMLNDAETQFAAGNVDEAIELASRALEATGSGGDFELRALNLLGMLQVENGEEDEARAYLQRAVVLDEEGMMDEKVGGGAEKFLFLAQLSEEGGKDSVRWFERGASVLRRQMQALSDLGPRTSRQQSELGEKQQQLGGVLCAVAEVYMTDLSWEDDAESRCEALITEAMMIAPEAAETWQTVANVRVSQERTGEARTALTRSLELWRDLPPEHAGVPEFPTRIALARLLLETQMEEEALTVLERLVSEDDESVEAWYLGGWCLYMTGEKQREGAGRNGGCSEEEEEEEEEWKGTWSTARKWLARCLKLHAMLEYEDERLGDHAVELFENINQELGPMPEGEEEEWEEDGEGEGEDDVGEDEEMQD